MHKRVVNTLDVKCCLEVAVIPCKHLIETLQACFTPNICSLSCTKEYIVHVGAIVVAVNVFFVFKSHLREVNILANNTTCKYYGYTVYNGFI